LGGSGTFLEVFEMNAIKRVEVRDPLNFMKPVLETWADRVALVSRSFPQSQSSYYLESTLVSLLSGAAWSHGVPAITEVKIKRVSANSADRAGRMDLLMRYGEKRVALEAKLIWDSELVPGNIWTHCELRALRSYQFREVRPTYCSAVCSLCRGGITTLKSEIYSRWSLSHSSTCNLTPKCVPTIPS
jgi:hypothetical protein